MPPLAGNAVDRVGHGGGIRAALRLDPGSGRWRRRPCGWSARLAAVAGRRGKVDAAHAGLRGEGHERCAAAAEFAAAEIEFLLGEHDDAAALGRLVGERGELRGVGEPFASDAGRGHELAGLAVAERDRAGLVEEQHVDVARGLDGAAGRREDVALQQAVHAGDADGAEQAADGRRNEADQQRDQRRDGEGDVRVSAERFQRDDDEQEDEGERGEQNRERDLVGRLLARRALDEADHVIEKTLAGIRRDADRRACRRARRCRR